MVKGTRAITIPNRHAGDVDWSLMRRVLKEADITMENWEQTK
jgi:hypothetical protein